MHSTQLYWFSMNILKKKLYNRRGAVSPQLAQSGLPTGRLPHPVLTIKRKYKYNPFAQSLRELERQIYV